MKIGLPLTALLMSSASLLLPGSALAQDGARHQENMHASPETASESGLGEIVVTAQKRAQSLQDVPISVSVLSSATLAGAQISNPASLPQIAPSLTFTQGFGPVATSFNIRGVGSYVSEIGVQPAVSLVLDGVALARNAEFISQFGDLERIEVLNGPQGTLFGRNSTGGAVNIVRKGPSNTFGANLDARLSSGKEGGIELLTRFGITGPIAEGVRGRLSGYMIDRSNFIENIATLGRNHGGEHSWGLVGKLAFDIGDNVELLLTGEMNRYRARVGENHVLEPIAQVQQPNIPGVTARQTALLGGVIGDLFRINQDGLTESWMDNQGVTADLTAGLTDSLVLRSITAYRHVEVRTQPDTDSTPASPSNPLGWDVLAIPRYNLLRHPPYRTVEWRYWSQEMRLEYSSSRFDVIAGAFYQNFREKLLNGVPLLLSAQSLGRSAAVDTPAGPSSSFPYYFNDSAIFPKDRNETFAGFLDITVRPTENLDIFAGYRLSHEKLSYHYDRTTFFFPVQFGVTYDPATMSPLVPGARVVFDGRSADTNWAGRLGARYAFSPAFSVYATASRGYIGAGVDLSRATAASAVNTDAAFLNASTARNLEIGFKSELFNRHVRLNGAVFDLLVKDLQAQSIIPGTVASQVQNAGDIRSRGFELNLDAAPTDQLTFNGGLSYNESKFRNFSTACYAGQTAAEGCVGGTQRIDGKPGLNNPKWKFNLGATYRVPLNANGSASVYVSPRYSYQSRVFFTLDHDPKTSERGYGLLDLTVGISGDNDRYDFSIFAKNITNKHFCLSKQAATIIGRTFCQSVSFDAQRLIGASGRVRF